MREPNLYITNAYVAGEIYTTRAAPPKLQRARVAALHRSAVVRRTGMTAEGPAMMLLDGRVFRLLPTQGGASAVALVGTTFEIVAEQMDVLQGEKCNHWRC